MILINDTVECRDDRESGGVLVVGRQYKVTAVHYNRSVVSLLETPGLTWSATRFEVTNKADTTVPLVESPAAGTGVKHDAGKPPISIIPRCAILAEARVFAFGAKKYGKHNFRGGMDWSRVVDAMLRHTLAFADGEDLDPETGESHLAHARCCASMLLYFIEHKVGKDDRKPESKKEDK